MVGHALFYLSVLSTVGAAAENPDFKTRPPAEVARAFPSPGSFKEVHSRRLKAEGGKPERRLFEAEERGHRFVYEFAGESTAEQVLDVDKEHAVEKIACRPFYGGKQRVNSIMWLRWNSAAMSGSNASARTLLKPGDLVTGGPGWNCGTKEDAGFLRQVVSVRSYATTENPTTEITAVDVSPLQVFKDLYVDFTWMQPASHQDSRMLSDNSDWDVDFPIVDFNFNYDAETKRAKKPIDMGLLMCENCYAHLRPVMKFRMVTSAWYLKEVVLRFEIEAGISIDVTVHDRTVTAINTTLSGWDKLLSESGPDFLRDLLAVTVPLFVGIADALNLVAYPITEMFSRFGDDLLSLIAEARLSASLSLLPNETFIELGWNSERGIYTEMGFNLHANLGLSGIPLVKEVFVGLKLCAGVAIVIGNSKEPLTSLTLCPEVLLGKTAVEDTEDATRGLVIPDMSHTEFVPDKQMCITFKNFETDLDLDTIWDGLFAHDEPSAEVCFQGKCEATSFDKRFSGKTVTWNEEKCMNVVQSHLFGDEAGSLAFVVREHDPFGFSQQYTQQQLWKLPDDCKDECEMLFDKMRIPPSIQHRGEVAKLAVKIKFKELGRRVTSTGKANKSITCGPRQSAVATTIALGGQYGGITYPNIFREGQGDEVAPPADAPVMRPADAQLSCVDVQNLPEEDVDGILSGAPGQECKLLLIPMIFLAFVALEL